MTDVPWAIVFEDGLGLESPEERLLPRHPVMLYESFCYGCFFIILLLVYRKYRSETPRGLLIGLFFIMVFTARFILEFYKMRQAEFAENLPLSVGQMLSIPLVIAGIVLLIRRRPAPPLETELQAKKTT